jgi:hypothetical protein
MICYMPFTDIEDRFLDKLAAVLGTVTIYCPSPGMVSDHMLAAAREERLDLRSGHGVPADDLARAVHEFKAWADLHGGDIADLAGLSKSMQGRPPLVDDTNPTSIGDQIRHFGEQNLGEAADPVFQAALFLSMAQQFDQQQVAVSRDLGKVLATERVMLARLAGDAQDLNEGLGAVPVSGVAAGISDTGGFMTAMRVRSWAELACRDTGPRSFILYVTSSSAVFEHLLDQFEQAQGPLRISLNTASNGDGHSNRKVIEALESLASANDPAAVSADCFHDSGDEAHPANLTIYTLAGISPSDFPHHLSAAGNRIEPGPNPGRGGVNTLIGLMEG